MIANGLATASEAIFDLDFHAVMHWGKDPALEKQYVPARSQRTRSVLTFFAQDTGTHNLVYANADLTKATQNREAIAFCDHWKQVSGADPKMLIMDQKVTTQHVLGELDARGVKFATLRMRSASLMRYINTLTSSDYTTVPLSRPGPHNRPKVHEDPAWPRPSPPPSGSACPATTPTPPPTPSSAASWTPPARSSTTATASPSRSTAAPTHPPCATPASQTTPPSPGGTDAGSASSSPDLRGRSTGAEIGVRC